MTVIYTPLPIEMVLEGIDREGARYQELEVEGAILQVEHYGVNRCRVVRLISSNPMDYLQNGYQPGTELEFVPQFSE